jgi:5-methylcytosine-specific restriction endonuclease McrA
VQTRADWFEFNQPNHEGYYQCGLCPYWVHCDETVLDHIKPKGSFPELKYVLSNLQPAHWICNQEKGSMSMEQWRELKGIRTEQENY